MSVKAVQLKVNNFVLNDDQYSRTIAEELGGSGAKRNFKGTVCQIFKI